MKTLFFILAAALVVEHANAATSAPVVVDNMTTTTTSGPERLQPLVSELPVPASMAPTKVTCYFIKFWDVFGGGWHSLGCYGTTVVHYRSSGEPISQTPTGGQVSEGNKTMTVTYDQPIKDEYVVVTEDGTINCTEENTSPYSTVTMLKGTYKVDGNTVTYNVVVK